MMANDNYDTIDLCVYHFHTKQLLKANNVNNQEYTGYGIENMQ